MQTSVFTFHPDGGPAFELWAPEELRQIPGDQVPAPEMAGALVAENPDGFQPSLVVGHNRVSPEMTFAMLLDRVQAMMLRYPGAALQPERKLAGSAGEIRVASLTRDGDDLGRVYQLTACLLAPLPPADPGDPAAPGPDAATRPSGGDAAIAPGTTPEPAEPPRDLVFLTGTCLLEQADEWDRAFIDAARTVRFA